MKILEINERYEESGGQSIFFFEIIDALREKGHEVYSCGFADKARQAESELIFKDTKNFFLRQLKRFTFDFSTYFKLRKWIKEINPEVIHLHGINKSTASILLACRGYKTVMTVHNYGLVCPTIWCVHKDDLKVCEGGIGWKCVAHKCLPRHVFLVLYVYWKILRYLLDWNVDVFISPSRELEKYLIKHNFKGVINQPHFVNIDKIRCSTKKTKDIDLLYVGRLRKEKGISSLIKAMGIVVKKKPDVKLVIVGQGYEKNDLDNLIKELGLQNSVTFIDEIPFDKVKEYYSRAKILVLPSIYMEQFGLVGIEAMVCGVPAIASNRGGIPEWCIHNKTGLLFEPNNVDDLSEKIILLLEDDVLRETLAKNGKEFVKKFDKDKQVNSFLSKINSQEGQKG